MSKEFNIEHFREDPRTPAPGETGREDVWERRYVSFERKELRMLAAYLREPGRLLSYGAETGCGLGELCALFGAAGKLLEADEEEEKKEGSGCL